MSAQQHKAILDIGSNSFHFVLYQTESDKSFQTVMRKRIIYRLGKQKQNEKSFLSEEDFVHAEKYVLELKAISDSFSCEMTTTATSAVREASNKDAFLKHIKDTTGIAIEILSGEQEALLLYKAILYYEKEAFSKKVLCLDIGGGSTECILGSAGKIIFVESVTLGAVRLSDQFSPTGFIDLSEIEKCRSFIKEKLGKVIKKLHSENFDLVFGNSGTIHAMKALVAENSAELTLAHTEERILTSGELNKSVALLLSVKTTEERKKIPGIEEDRADILPFGALILQTLFDELNIQKLYLSNSSMREGKLLEALEKEESNNDYFNHTK